MHDSVSAQLSILLVEPSDVQRKVITKHLVNAGIANVDNAKSITEAKEKLPIVQPDLVISALYFEDGEGLEILHYIQSPEYPHDTFFMLVSSEHKREQLEHFRQAGCIAILPKPFTVQHLQRAIRSTLDLIEPEPFELQNFEVEALRVLLVDDSQFSRQYLKRVFESIGVHLIIEASNGHEGVEALRTHEFDLICTDYHMPEMDGSQLAQAARQELNLTHLPIMMVSARADELLLTQVEQSGVNALTDKPFEPEMLKQTLKQLLDPY